jgi:hypothetical protein
MPISTKRTRNRRIRRALVPRSGYNAPIPRLPQLTASPIFNLTFRFYMQPAVAPVHISRAAMLNRLVMGSSAIAAYRIFSGAKINKVDMLGYVNPATIPSTTPATVQLQWISEEGCPKLITDTSVSLTVPPTISSRPPVRSLASFWSLTGTNEADELFTFSSSFGGVMDINLSFILQDSVLGEFSPVVLVVTGAVAGTIGAPALDHGASATTVPVGWPNYA